MVILQLSGVNVKPFLLVLVQVLLRVVLVATYELINNSYASSI
jgi:hypothetical protein